MDFTNINLFEIFDKIILSDDNKYINIIDKIIFKDYKITFEEINKNVIKSSHNGNYLKINKRLREKYYNEINIFTKKFLLYLYLELYKINNKLEDDKLKFKDNFEIFYKKNKKIEISINNLFLKFYELILNNSIDINIIEYLEKGLDIEYFLIQVLIIYIYNDNLYDYIDNTYNNIRYIDYIIHKYKSLNLNYIYPYTLLNNKFKEKLLINKLYFSDPKNKIFISSNDNVQKLEIEPTLTPLIINRISKKYFNNNDLLNNEINEQFIKINEYPERKTTNLLSLNNKIYSINTPNMIMYDYLLFDQACYFKSSLDLILLLFNIKLPEQIDKANYKEKLKDIFIKANITNENKINKLIEFYDIIINSKSPYFLTNIYNFLIRNGFEKFIKYIGVLGYQVEPALILTIILKILYQMDININNICGIELNDLKKTKTFILNINEPQFIKDLVVKNDGCLSFNLKDKYLFGGDDIKPFYIDKDNYDCIKEVNLSNYLRFNYDKILDLTEQINNTPEVLIININTIFNNLNDKSNPNNINKKYINKCSDYMMSLYYQYYKQRFIYYCNCTYLVFSNKYIKIKDTYYKLFSILNTNNKGRHTELQIINNYLNKINCDEFNKINLNNINLPIIYVYKKCKLDELYINNTIEQKDITQLPYIKKNYIIELNNKFKNIYNLKLNNMLYNFNFSNINDSINYILYIKKIEEININDKLFYNLLQEINDLYNKDYNKFVLLLKEKKILLSTTNKINKDKFLFNLLFYNYSKYINLKTYKLFYLNNNDFLIYISYNQQFKNNEQINKYFKLFDYQEEQRKKQKDLQKQYSTFDFYEEEIKKDDDIFF